MWLVSFFMSVINLLFKMLPSFDAFMGLNPIQACIFFGLEGYSSVLHSSILVLRGHEHLQGVKLTFFPSSHLAPK